jgi:hypothetical protein
MSYAVPPLPAALSFGFFFSLFTLFYRSPASQLCLPACPLHRPPAFLYATRKPLPLLVSLLYTPQHRSFTPFLRPFDSFFLLLFFCALFLSFFPRSSAHAQAAVARPSPSTLRVGRLDECPSVACVHARLELGQFIEKVLFRQIISKQYAIFNTNFAHVDSRNT